MEKDPRGIEPMTFAFLGKHSNQLSKLQYSAPPSIEGGWGGR